VPDADLALREESKMRRILVAAAAAIAVCALEVPAAVAQQAASPPQAAGAKTFHILAVEFKMRRKVSETPYPNTLQAFPELANAPGYKLIPPNTEVQGEWGVDAYQFLPATIVVNQGDNVVLRFYGVNGDLHATTIDGYNQKFDIKRGQLTEVKFVADKAGTFTITCHNHPPTMTAHLVVQASAIAPLAGARPPAAGAAPASGPAPLGTGAVPSSPGAQPNPTGQPDRGLGGPGAPRPD
jgi:plastocyanin